MHPGKLQEKVSFLSAEQRKCQKIKKNVRGFLIQKRLFCPNNSLKAQRDSGYRDVTLERRHAGGAGAKMFVLFADFSDNTHLHIFHHVE